MDNLTRMIRLAHEFFETKNDPSQLTITEEVMDQLRSIHSATMGEFTYGEGPVAWTIVFPTTRPIRKAFMKGTIGETELLEQTLNETNFTSLYLCSALVLPEFRGKGLAKKLVCDSIRSIRKDHPIDELFVWSFSSGGKELAKIVAATMALPLFER